MKGSKKIFVEPNEYSHPKYLQDRFRKLLTIFAPNLCSLLRIEFHQIGLSTLSLPRLQDFQNYSPSSNRMLVVSSPCPQLPDHFRIKTN